MNERIKELAEQAGCYQEQDDDGTWFLAMAEGCWEKFAELIRADEREACAKIADEKLFETSLFTSLSTGSNVAWNISNEIRARGEVK